ncbi:hypothetical protein HYDPIDRAFT_113391 [Hydnomerulius pinastri MD-312]|uniref:DUF6593 domain-containing protein n=1 Tax=Hydnomerulius pinastri MD-312 TaxID=994086 RepID=A0A0C9WDV9_9AGAM|nr:hypothetical protein HYDPIDRAFT_113391 [Hydnomerulius pinastri MD-312]
MTSQQTLVATIAQDAPSGASVILDFKRDVITSTTITVRGQLEGVIRYKVETTTSGLIGINIKLIISENDRVLATIRRRDMLPDQLTFSGGSSMSLSKWLKWPKISAFPVTFEEFGQCYAWKRLDNDRIALYKESGSDEIAWYNPSYQTYDNSGERIMCPAFLALKAEADAIRTKILISCILVVQRMRAKQRARNSVKYSTTPTLGLMALTGSNLGGSF